MFQDKGTVPLSCKTEEPSPCPETSFRRRDFSPLIADTGNALPCRYGSVFYIPTGMKELLRRSVTDNPHLGTDINNVKHRTILQRANGNAFTLCIQPAGTAHKSFFHMAGL